MGDELTRATGILTALGQKMGPASGTDTYLIYDTNRTGAEPILDDVAPYLSYVFLQAYGRQVSSLESTWETFEAYIEPCQFLVGFSFYEENGHAWGTPTRPPTSDAGRPSRPAGPARTHAGNPRGRGQGRRLRPRAGP